MTMNFFFRSSLTDVKDLSTHQMTQLVESLSQKLLVLRDSL